MPLFQFQPKSECLDHPDWETSIHRGECYVNARNREDAIKAIISETGIAARVVLGREIPQFPWKNPTLVDVSEIDMPAENLPSEGKVLFDRF